MNSPELLFRRVIYVALLSLAPGFVFLLQVMLFAPPAMILSSALHFGWSILTTDESESPILLGFFFAHFLLFAGLYWLVALVLGKCIVWFRKSNTRGLLLALVLFGIAAVSQLSIYGGGGHGPSQLGPIQSLLTGDPHSVGYDVGFYLMTVAVLAGIALLLQLVHRLRGADAS